jgi:hypothetical protein
MNRSYRWIILGLWIVATSARAADSSPAKPLYSLAPGTRWSYDRTQEIVQIIGSKTNVTHVTGTDEEEILPAPAHYKQNGDTVLSRSISKEQRETDSGMDESGGGTVLILEWRRGDLYLHGGRIWIDGSYSEGMNLYQPALPYLKSSAHPGEAWKVGTQKNMALDLPTTAVMDVPETVTVPAGTFTNCLKVVYKSVVESLINETRVESGNVQDTIWYAKDVGVVKEFQVTVIKSKTKQGTIFDREEVTKVLKSHVPAK